MLKNQELYTFLSERTREFTEQWYETLDKSKGGVYGTKNPEKIEQLKQQNHEFHVRFSAMFIKEREEFLQDFQEWISQIAKDEGHLSTRLADILEEFFRTEKQYHDAIKNYAVANTDLVSHEQLADWINGVSATINQIVQEFTVQNTKLAESRLDAQQQLILEMSAPVILLTENIGLLPLIGEITTHRAQVLLEKTLEQSVRHELDILYIDLSGVPVIDTMVAQQIFQLISSLKLVGVNTALSGISPVIAQTAVQLGIDFKEIEVYGTLAQAIRIRELKVQ